MNTRIMMMIQEKRKMIREKKKNCLCEKLILGNKYYTTNFN